MKGYALNLFYLNFLNSPKQLKINIKITKKRNNDFFILTNIKDNCPVFTSSNQNIALELVPGKLANRGTVQPLP